MDIEVTDISYSKDHSSFRVCATITGKYGKMKLRHVFPYKKRLFEENEQGVKKFVERLKKLYERKASERLRETKKEKPEELCGKYQISEER